MLENDLHWAKKCLNHSESKFVTFPHTSDLPISAFERVEPEVHYSPCENCLNLQRHQEKKIKNKVNKLWGYIHVCPPFFPFFYLSVFAPGKKTNMFPIILTKEKKVLFALFL